MPSISAELNLLKLTLGSCLIFAAWLIFSLWREKLSTLRDEERMNFLMYNVVGGSWLFAIFALCGGFYFLLETVLRL